MIPLAPLKDLQFSYDSSSTKPRKPVRKLDYTFLAGSLLTICAFDVSSPRPLVWALAGPFPGTLQHSSKVLGLWKLLGHPLLLHWKSILLDCSERPSFGDGFPLHRHHPAAAALGCVCGQLSSPIRTRWSGGCRIFELSPKSQVKINHS